MLDEIRGSLVSIVAGVGLLVLAIAVAWIYETRNKVLEIHTKVCELENALRKRDRTADGARKFD
jgi:hypothetical protein